MWHPPHIPSQFSGSYLVAEFARPQKCEFCVAGFEQKKQVLSRSRIHLENIWSAFVLLHSLVFTS
jgi:hypothetical protein